MYHKKLAAKGVIFSELDDIEGIGPVRKKTPMARFGSVDGVRRANKEELLHVEGIDERSAENIISYFKER